MSMLEAFREELPDKIAVLFTDIVGSTDYFKKHGDRKGREMLQYHYDIVTSIVSEYNGTIVKMIGDSVMAYFVDAAEALKSGIMMQQRFPGDMAVKIGIHYGSVIIESKDLYGDIVNVAAKMTNITRGGQIYVSREVYESTLSLGSINFEPVFIWDKKTMPDDLTIYRVVWDESIDLGPTVQFILGCSPAWPLCDDVFRDVWEDIVQKKTLLWEGKATGEHVLRDSSFALIFKGFDMTCEVAGDIMHHLSEHLTQKMNRLFLPVRFFVDVTENYQKKDKMAEEGIDELREMDPGILYVTETVKEIIDDDSKKRMEQTSRSYRGKRLFWLDMGGGEQYLKDRLLMYKRDIIEGGHAPCYYCGSKKHKPIDCPSKSMPDFTHALDKLGYLPMESINRLYLSALLADSFNADFSNERVNGGEVTEMTPVYGFYELTRVFQLRFFRTIWNVGEGEWNVIRNSRTKVEGGMLWLAQDSLRVSDMEKAKSILDRFAQENPPDFKLYCILGFMHIENGDHGTAEAFFHKALSCASTSIQKIFILLHLARLFLVDNKHLNASKIVADILSLSPNCVDALYMDVLIRLNLEKSKTALQRFVKLILSDRIYFVHALIDPALEPYSMEISDKMTDLFNEIKENASSTVETARQEFERVRPMLDDQTITELQADMVRANGLRDGGGFFGYLDSISLSNSIIMKCRDYINEKRRSFSDIISQLDGRIQTNLSFIKTCRFPGLVAFHQKSLEKMREQIKAIDQGLSRLSKVSIVELENVTSGFCKTLDKIESHFERVSLLQKVADNLHKLLRNSIIYLVVVVFTSLFLLPILIYYTNMALSSLGMETIANTWHYQKFFLIFGGITGIGLSFFVTIKDILKDS